MTTTENIMSLCIPFVLYNFDKNYVANSFARIGDVKQVDFVAKSDCEGNLFNAVYVYFFSWNDNVIANELYYNIIRYGKVQFYYDAPLYWVVLPNNYSKSIYGQLRRQQIDFREDEDNVTSSVSDVFEHMYPIAPTLQSNHPIINLSKNINFTNIDFGRLTTVEECKMMCENNAELEKEAISKQVVV